PGGGACLREGDRPPGRCVEVRMQKTGAGLDLRGPPPAVVAFGENLPGGGPPAMTTQADKATSFQTLHRQGRPLLMPNPWDAGSAKLLASLGFDALATTSSGHAATHGRLDYHVTREEALTNAAEIIAATELPVSADLENCFAEEPDGVA